MEEIDLSDFFNTKEQASDFSIHLAEVSEDIFRTGFDLEKSLIKHFGIKKRDQFISLLRNNKVNIYINSELKIFFEKIQKSISELPVLSLVIAFEPNEETFKMLSEWFILNLHRQVLLDISVNFKIIAGATVSFEGKYTDCSIKPVFDQIFQDVLMNESKAVEKILIPQAEQPVTGQIINR